MDLDTVRLIAGDQADLSVEDALFAARAARWRRQTVHCGRSSREGASAVGLVRAAHVHMDKLARVAAAREAGLSAQDAVKALRPPVFFRRERAMIEAADIWRMPALSAVQLALREAEMQCKRTGMPAEAIAHAAIIAIARRAARLKGR